MATKFDKKVWEAFIKGEVPAEVKPCEKAYESNDLSNINLIYKLAKEKSICTEPLDIVNVAKEIFGIKVFFSDLDRTTSGFIERTSDMNWAIHVNRWENPLRQRFTIAHELGHLVMHRDILKSGSHSDQILYRDEHNSQIEKEASEFAANLLMPQELFDKYLNEGLDTIGQLSEKFQLSSSAVKYRAFKLKYISEY